MKTKILLLLAVMTLSISCIEDEVEKLGKSDCAVTVENELDELEDEYQKLMLEPDSDGNDQSLEACLNRQLATQTYFDLLLDDRTKYTDREGCTLEEKVSFNVRISERTQDLHEDMVSIWNRCEEIFGGG
ncbi:hypothetical protein [Aequorivita lipolytica]|uniref:Uncharacterized protein n=1 Tax=Aequorivita lipolytica TaxID=153267 RepID=A0A5C6YMZ7_9FLAO|nr:hypothetical protein [Aequorivita lipolytica]TXD68580.1 hypothetical protein ESV24_11750 [Aequorivita lipolytica]SRX53270.1 hypothetical protein AEQU2_02500 [Aequorivita lipolytica]